MMTFTILYKQGYFSASFNEINNKNNQTDNINAFALQSLHIKNYQC